MDPYVPCLKKLCSLEELCEREGLIFRNEVPGTKEYISITAKQCKEVKIPCLLNAQEFRRICCNVGITYTEYISITAKQCKEVKIPCLLNDQELRRICCNVGITYTDEYEVEEILEDSKEDGVHWYFVKWKNYDDKDSSWEPEKHLIGCDNLLKEYKRSKILFPLLSNGFNVYDIVDSLRRLTMRKPYDVVTLLKLSVFCGMDGENGQISSDFLKELREKMDIFSKLSEKRLLRLKFELSSIITLARKRSATLAKLKTWEREINKCHTGAPIQVQNDVDCAGPPDFRFIHDYVYIGFSLNDDCIVGCECTLCDPHQSKCCAGLAEAGFAYDRYGYLRLKPGYPIYECNILCKCGPDCINRVVQRGQRVKLEIFRTRNSRGWGLRTLHRLKKGQFVLEYIGEVITSEEADKRRYDDGECYLFDLDFEATDCTYTVDAKHVGNAAHFINHSCNPNMHVFAVWINHLDNLFPRLAFFTKREIKGGEELTFDYRMNKDNPIRQLVTPQSTPVKKRNVTALCSTTQQSNVQSVKRILCLCGTPKCRGYLF